VDFHQNGTLLCISDQNVKKYYYIEEQRGWLNLDNASN